MFLMKAKLERFFTLKAEKDLTIKRLVMGTFIVFMEYFIYTNLHKSTF